MRVIVGAGGTSQAGWQSLEAAQLDIRDFRQWERLFQPASLDALLAEHVIEHLTMQEAQATVRNFYYFLRRGGYARVAVPDGFYFNESYLNWVAPNSPGEKWLDNFRDAYEPPHKVLWNYLALAKLFIGGGFRVVLREWHDGQGRLHKTEWSAEQGAIKRCAGSLYSALLGLVVGTDYRSLILDAYK
jgi:predicted SAM-dependent methyltransferase